MTVEDLVEELRPLAELGYGGYPAGVATPISSVAAREHAPLSVLLATVSSAARTFVPNPWLGENRPPPPEHLERLGEIACGGDERCFYGALYTPMDWVPVFVRDVPLIRVSREQISMAKLWMVARSQHLAVPQSFDESFNLYSVTTDRVVGCSLDDLPELSPPLALVILAEGLRGLGQLHRHGMTHGGLTARRVRLRPDGRVVLCFGVDAGLPRAHEESAELARLVLSKAYDDQILADALATGGPGALEIAYDRLVEIDASVDELAHAALRGVPDDEVLTGLLDRLAPASASIELIRRIIAVMRASPWTTLS